MKQYSFYNVDLYVNGIFIDGYSDGSSIITAGRSSPQHGKVMDARGKMVAITSADKSGVIAFNLLQTSDANAIMQLIAMKSHDDGTSGNSDTFIPIQAMLRDKMGDTVATGVNGFISMQPPVTRGTSLAAVPWTLEFEQLQMLRGTSVDVGL